MFDIPIQHAGFHEGFRQIKRLRRRAFARADAVQMRVRHVMQFGFIVPAFEKMEQPRHAGVSAADRQAHEIPDVEKPLFQAKQRLPRRVVHALDQKDMLQIEQNRLRVVGRKIGLPGEFVRADRLPMQGNQIHEFALQGAEHVHAAFIKRRHAV